MKADVDNNRTASVYDSNVEQGHWTKHNHAAS